MTALVPPTTLLPAIPALAPAGGASAGVKPDGGAFLGMLQNALGATSSAQNAAAGAEQAVATGAPGASTAKALVLSDQAEVDWSSLVATRNEVVSAYQTIMNMQV